MTFRSRKFKPFAECAGAAAGGGGGVTLISDNFNRANTTAGLGTSSDGTWSWTEVGQNAGIQSNQVYCPVTSGTQYDPQANIDLASSDHWAQVTYPVGAGAPAANWGVHVRYSSITPLTYYSLIYRSSGTRYELWKCVSGTNTMIANGVTLTAAGVVGDTIKLQITGSSLTGYRNGTAITGITAITDTAIASGTRVGLQMQAVGAGNTRLDDFSAGT
jgi:hypothetical protein